QALGCLLRDVFDAQARARGIRVGGDHVDAEVGGRVDAVLALDVRVLLVRRPRVQSLSSLGPDEREKGPRGRQVGEADLASEAVGLEHVLQDSVSYRLRVEQEAARRSQQPQVGADLALMVEEHRVAPLPRRERAYGVADLPLQEVGGLAPADLEYRASRALDY